MNNSIDAQFSEFMPPDMFYPLMSHMVPVGMLRSKNGDILWNCGDWPVESVRLWSDALGDLFDRRMVEFKRLPDSDVIDGHDPEIVCQLKTLPDKREYRKRIHVGFTESGGLAWERAVRLDWSSFLGIEANEETCSVTVITLVEESAALFDSKKRWGAEQASKEIIEFYPVFYWRRFAVAHKRSYSLSEEQFANFLRVQRWRGWPPALPKSDNFLSGKWRF